MAWCAIDLVALCVFGLVAWCAIGLVCGWLGVRLAWCAIDLVAWCVIGFTSSRNSALTHSLVFVLCMMAGHALMVHAIDPDS